MNRRSFFGMLAALGGFLGFKKKSVEEEVHSLKFVNLVSPAGWSEERIEQIKKEFEKRYRGPGQYLILKPGVTITKAE